MYDQTAKHDGQHDHLFVVMPSRDEAAIVAIINQRLETRYAASEICLSRSNDDTQCHIAIPRDVRAGERDERTEAIGALVGDLDAAGFLVPQRTDDAGKRVVLGTANWRTVAYGVDDG